MLEQADTILRSMTLRRERVPSFETYPFVVPAIRALTEELEFHPRVTYFVGENGSGKSTIVEALAVALGFNAEGGSKNFRFATRSSESSLHTHLRVARGFRRMRTGFFLRAESFFNVATEIERLDREPFGASVIGGYGGVYQHEQSHGESFRALLENRFQREGLYILDEPEAALSPRRQLDLVRRLHRLVARERAQFVVATHSPIVLAYPDARIYELSDAGITPRAYTETQTYRFTAEFFRERENIVDAIIAE